MRSVAIIQARMGSSRLPGKVMKPLAGIPALWHVVTRVAAAQRLDDIIIATSTLAQDDVIEAYGQEHGWSVFRGSEQDVLARYVGAAMQAKADVVVRITSDCPLIDPEIIDAMLDIYMAERPDYLSTNYPSRSFPIGLDVEICAMEGLVRADKEATQAYEREHVTPYFYNHPELFNLQGYANTSDQSHQRWVLDTPEDYAFLEKLYDALYQPDGFIRTSDIHHYLHSSD